MTSSTEFNVWNSCSTIPFHITMTESAVQFNGFFVMDMIKQDWLIHGYPTENGEDGIEERCCLKPIAIVSNDGEYN
jgi:hypothetical protein